MLTSVDRCSKNIRVHSVVVAELKFRDVERHVFGAHLVERADRAAFEDRPEAFDGVGVDRAAWPESAFRKLRCLSVPRPAPAPDRRGRGPAESRARV